MWTTILLYMGSCAYHHASSWVGPPAHRADSRFVPSQWETALLCNDVSHWLGTILESALGPCYQIQMSQCEICHNVVSSTGFYSHFEVRFFGNPHSKLSFSTCSTLALWQNCNANALRYLTHCPLEDVTRILDIWFPNEIQSFESWTFPAELPWGEYQKTTLMISQ